MSHSQLSRLERGESEPSLKRLNSIAALYGCAVPDLLGLSIELDRVAVIGAVQAGEWSDDGPWMEDDQYGVSVPVPPEFAHMSRFGLEVHGPSMNLVYPEGTVLVCVSLAELERWPDTGEMVIVQRRSNLGLETTVKEFVHDNSGVWLWPRSNHPEHQQPVPLPRPHADGEEQQLAISDFMAVEEDHGEEIAVIALVIQSVRNETKRRPSPQASEQD